MLSMGGNSIEKRNDAERKTSALPAPKSCVTDKTRAGRRRDFRLILAVQHLGNHLVHILGQGDFPDIFYGWRTMVGTKNWRG